MQHNFDAKLSFEEYDKTCCLCIEHCRRQHAGEYQVILTNTIGVTVESKSSACIIEEVTENGNNEDSDSRNQVHTTLALAIKRQSQDYPTYSIDRTVHEVSFGRDSHTYSSAARQSEVGSR
ncbi:unnamed protein product, partial [Rotaria sp. Silwood2]